MRNIFLYQRPAVLPRNVQVTGRFFPRRPNPPLGHWLFHRYTHLYIDDARIDGEVITVSSRVSGWITELPVIEGDELRKGQLIARVDDRDSLLQREALMSKQQAGTSRKAISACSMRQWGATSP